MGPNMQSKVNNFNASSASAVATVAVVAATVFPKDWSSLMEPLLVKILHHLDTLQDFFAFLGVCRGWRALASTWALAPIASFRNPLLLTRFPGYTEAFYDIVAGSRCPGHLPWSVSFLRSVSYAYGYLVAAADSAAGGSKILLWDIFTGATIRVPVSPKPFHRVLFSARPGSPDCLVLAFKNQKTELQLFRFDDPFWSVIDTRRTLSRASDLIFFNNKLYAVTPTLQLVALNLVGPPQYELLGSDFRLIGYSIQFQARWLAVSGEDLLVVCDKVEGGFIIFRWNFSFNFWDEVTNFGGRALFMDGRGFARSVPASDMGVRGDCIFYLDCYQDRWFMFSLEDQSTTTVPLSSHKQLTGLVPLPPIWVFPSIH